ncbi:LLM class flavin-dependent oxidoreductase [Nocardioides panacis]|uniref:LLM class flavin-dependent oxidoreductase n=1 Tax=Nocardioides panacis TaxID=2849501 RepID=A0A975SV89_9ACTN|nr:LLM class flavin-dependent oxidoreductase [Nocardioides panacis]QWZ06476.1 LLM class flavin-dependent oxidoreductase [Nocardioides panacis]
MSIKLHWFLPTTGDARGLVGGGGSVPLGGGRPTDGAGSAHQFREPDIEYLASIARTADQLGFEGVLTPTGTWCEDAWLVTAALIRETRNLKFLVAFRPGVTSPTLSAQMAAAFQRISRGRLLLNVVTGGDPTEQKRFGDHLGHAERYARTDEFLSVVRGAWSQAPYDFDGTYYQIEGAEIRGTIDPVPDIYFGGSSGPAGPVAAKHADVYLTWGEPPEQVAEKVRWIRGLAEEQGRTVRFGLRIHTLSRDTSEQAWAQAQWLLDGLDPATIAKAQQALAASESVGQQRMRSLHAGRTAFASAHDLEVSPNLWSGVGLVRGGAGTALVGSHQEVADRIEEYHRIGIDEFILSGYPHVEEAYWFAEGVMPVLRAKGIYGTQSPDQAARLTRSA